MFMGVPLSSLGPGNEYLAHTPKDVVPVRDLFRAAEIYTAMIMDIYV